jgi:hypothetical protein
VTLLFHLRLSGVLLILLGLAHGGFDRYLDWRRDIQKLRPINRQIFIVHWFYIALALFLMGVFFCLFARELLVPERLTRGIFLTTTLVWAIRLVFQWLLFRGDSWRNDGFNRKIHCLLTAIWIYLLTVNSFALARVLR